MVPLYKFSPLKHNFINLPKRLELSFLVVEALPNASNIGLESRIVSSILTNTVSPLLKVVPVRV